jgi:Icc-related predicted phosphoesterase
MRIVLVSDTHCVAHPTELPEGDMLVHAGDLCLRGNMEELDKATAWLMSLRKQFKQILVIAGNHDWPLVRDPDIGQRMMRDRGLTYLQDAGVTIEGIKFWGSPWTPTFFNWAFMQPRGGAIAGKWSLIPEDTDVLITHGPPYGILDPGIQADHVGCESLMTQLTYRIHPKLHVFGHLHDGYGQTQEMGTLFTNASLLDDSYRPVHEPVVVDMV